MTPLFSLKKLCSLWTVCLLSLTLVACGGFHLRGAVDLDPAKQSLQLSYDKDVSDGLLDYKLRQRLQQGNIDLANDGNYRILIESVENKRESVTFTSDARVGEYTLSLRVAFTLMRNSDKSSDRFVAQAERIYSYDADDQTAKDEQAELLRQELYDAVVNRIYSTYVRFAPKQ